MWQNQYVAGLVTGVVIGVLGWAFGLLVENRVVLFQILKGRTKRYSHLGGTWFQYHSSLDNANVEAAGQPIWVEHEEKLTISPFLKVRVKSTNNYRTKLSYKAVGKIEHRHLIIEYTNELSEEEMPARIILENLLSGAVLHGVWSGYNFDGHLTAGPVVFSRTRLSESELNTAIETRYDKSVWQRRVGP